MKKFLKQFSQNLGTPSVLLAVAMTCVSSRAASDKPAVRAAKETSKAPAQVAETNSAMAEVILQKSVFEDNLKNGKDPFYPKSTRRGEKEPVVGTVEVAPVVKLSLKGISGPANRRFALINNQPLAVGEDGYVRVPGGQVKVHCWEIREDSVVVSVEGDPEKKELRLREGL